MKLRVLIADPNREFQQMMAALLSRERDMEVEAKLRLGLALRLAEM